MTTDGGRQTVKYLVRCALAAGDSLTKQDQYGASYTFPGGMGLCPAWKNGGVHGTNFRTCQNLVSACMMAHVNTAGVHIPIWMASEAPQIGWGARPGELPEAGRYVLRQHHRDRKPAADGHDRRHRARRLLLRGRWLRGRHGARSARRGPGRRQPALQEPVRRHVQRQRATSSGHWSAGNSGGQTADGYKTAVVNGYVFQNGEPITVWRNPNTSSGGTSSTTICSTRRTATG